MLLKRLHLFLSLSILMQCYTITSGQPHFLQSRYNEQTFLVNNYSSPHNTSGNRTISKLLDQDFKGFIFKLISDSSTINYTTSLNTQKDFTEICEEINNYILQNENQVITLFLDYDINPDSLTAFLKKQKLYSKIYNEAIGNEWPTIESLLLKKKNIICFTYKKDKAKEPLIRYIWDYASEPETLYDGGVDINGRYVNGKSSNSLLYLTSFQYENAVSAKLFFNEKRDANQTPIVFSYCVDIWRNLGKKPNFIVFDRLRSSIRGIKGNLNVHKNIRGTVSYNRTLLDNIFWEGDIEAITHGKFCFPAAPSEDLLLKPQKQGFRFIPDQVLLEDIAEDKVQNFIAVPLDADEKLVAHLPFNDEIEDVSFQHQEINNHGVKITNDTQRGYVAEFDGKSFIALPGADDLELSNNDFTVSAWVKLSKVPTKEKRDFTILGTEESHYRGGLHLQTRWNLPYFGFFSNDLQGNTELDLNRWYHLVWRYTKYNQEQAIYIDGIQDCASLNHPPFISNGTIFIGKSINQNNLFEGRIDDIVIWSRALGDEEIWNIFQDVYYLNESNLEHFFLRYKVWITGTVLVILMMLLYVFIKKKSTKKQRKIKDTHEIEFSVETPTKNAIYLFGEFQVYDINGTDITDRFTPRIKQIFIYLLILSKEKPHGVSSDEFLNTIWPAFDRKKAINNRGVTISKLRTILESLNSIKVINIQDRWKLELTENVYCDYYESLKKLDKGLFIQRDKLNTFLSIIQRGAFLQDTMDECFDSLKGKYSNRVIDILTRLLTDFDIDQNPEIVMQIADRILKADDLNEDALKYKVKALMVMKQVNEARFIYKTFAAKYKEVYDDCFKVSFNEVIH